MPSERDTVSNAQPNVAIRPATSEDAAFIGDLTSRFAETGSPPWRDPGRMAHFFRRSIGEIAELVAADAVNPREAVLIATGEGAAPLGFIHLRPDLCGLTREWQGYVNALAVSATAEGRGIGRALLLAGESWARERGFRYLALDTFGTNERARAFYEHLGFAEESLKLVKVV